MKAKGIVILMAWGLCGSVWAYPFSAYKNYIFDPDDFAAQVISYSPVGMLTDWLSDQPFNDPNNALGRPTVDTTGDDWYIPVTQNVPVVPVYPAFRSFELVYLGDGGSLVLKFNRPVRDEVNNPYGIDFIVFGNALQVRGAGQGWTNGDPTQTTVIGSGFEEPAVISVSQDGVVWYSFTTNPNFKSGDPNFIKLPASENDGPFADSFAPTLGRVYDPENPDASIGAWNQWWSHPTNPTLPLDPSLNWASFAGWTVADIVSAYGYSAGGTGFDISRLDLPADPATGLKWFQYVRIDDIAGDGYTAEIDAVSAVTSCGDYKHPFPAADWNKDCRVDLRDAAILSQYWLDNSAPTPMGQAELMALSETWLDCAWDCD